MIKEQLLVEEERMYERNGQIDNVYKKENEEWQRKIT